MAKEPNIEEAKEVGTAASAAASQGGILLTDENSATIKLGDSLKSVNNNNKLFDIINDYPWTLTQKVNRVDVPTIELIEYELDINALYTQLSFWKDGFLGALGVEDDVNPYKDLYAAHPTGYSFIFPYFIDYDHSHAAQWPEYKMEINAVSKIVNLFKGLGYAFGAMGGGATRPKVFKGSSEDKYLITFMLYNTTVNSEDTTNGTEPNYKTIIKNNMIFKRRILMSTLHSQVSRLFISPPAIFEVKIPGIRYSPAAVISNINIRNVGQMNLMNIDSRNQNVPDAYEFQIEITELISEGREILNSEFTNNETQIISAITKNNTVVDPKTDLNEARDAVNLQSDGVIHLPMAAKDR